MGGDQSEDPAGRRSAREAWATNIVLTSGQLAEAGGTMLDLVQYGELWVNRRVETIRFVDETVVRRQLSLDFRLPSGARAVSGLDVGGTYFIPLTVLRRDTSLMRFDLRDERGRALPLLTRHENSRISAVMLVTGAERILEDAGQGPPSPRLKRALSYIPIRQPHTSQQFARAVLDDASKEWYWESLEGTEAQRHALQRSKPFANLVSLMIGRSVVVSPMQMNEGERRIVKLGFDEEPDRIAQRERSWRSRVAVGLGWARRPRRFDAPFVGSAESYHIEIEAPEDVEMTEAGLLARRPRERIEVRGATEPTESAEGYLEEESGPRQRAHLYLNQASKICSGVAWVGLRARRRGFLRGAFFAAALVASTLTFFAFSAPTLSEAQSSATSLLLLAPALLVGYALRPHEHDMARSLYGAARVFLGLTGLAAIVGAALVLHASPGDSCTVGSEGCLAAGSDGQGPAATEALWIGLAAFSWLMTGLLLVGNLRPPCNTLSSDS